MTETKERKKRSPKRNYAAELKGLKQYCEMRIDILEEFHPDTDGVDPEIKAYRNILKKLNEGTTK